MGRGRNAAKRKAKDGAREAPPEGSIAAYQHRQDIARRQAEIDIITPEQRAKGTYEGAGRITNRGGTPVMRWLEARKLSDTQELAIQLCYRLWALCGLEQRVTGSYGERMAASAVLVDHRAVTVLEATEDLYRIQGYIPAAYWRVFENVCRFDEPAGVAGHAAGYSSRTAERRALTIVCFVADIIATRERLLPEVRILVA